MKVSNINISPLPFYDDLSKQNHKKKYAFGQVWPLIFYKNTILPFQFNIHHDVAILNKDVIKVSLVNIYSEIITDITDEIKEAGLTLTSVSLKNINIKYSGISSLSCVKHEGTYYLEMEVELNNIRYTFYSDVFCIKNNIDTCILIEYFNTSNFELKEGIVDFSDNFKFRCYLDTFIGKPEYEFEEEATDRMGYSFIESQVSKKKYKFTFIAPEYLCDALRLIRLCDNKKITDSAQEYELINFAMEPKWEEQGDLAAVECEFETDMVIANTAGYVPVLKGGDFNDDYDESFLIDKIDEDVQ